MQDFAVPCLLEGRRTRFPKDMMMEKGDGLFVHANEF